MTTSLLGFLLSIMCAFGGGLRQQSDPCQGCGLFLVAYDNAGFFLGNVLVPGVAISMTPGIGSNSGTCSGMHPNCEGAPCKFGHVRVRIHNTGAGGPVKIQPVSVELGVGDSAGFNSRSSNPVGNENIACGERQSLS